MGRSDITPPSVGDVVLVEEENKPRGLWKLGRISGLITGKDGHTRGAILHVPSSGGDGVLQRPIQRLYPLEIMEKPKSIVSEPVETIVDHAENSETEKYVQWRPRRAAAIEARNKLAVCATLENDSEL